MKNLSVDNKAHIATLLVSLFLVTYVILVFTGGPYSLVIAMFSISPVLIAWMVYSILKFDKYDGPGLKGKDWGYQDRPDLSEDEAYDGLLYDQ